MAARFVGFRLMRQTAMGDTQVKAPQRPILRYHGGKWRMAPEIIRRFPPHSAYVEPFCGAGSVLLRKPRSRVEVLNDLHGRIVNVFRVLRDPEQSVRLEDLLRLTPYAEEEFLAAREVSDDPVEDARRVLVLGHQGHGSTGATGGKLTGWRRGARTRSLSSADEWGGLWRHVETWASRIRSVYIENRDACDVIRKWDNAGTLFYVDPPYVADTRTTPGAYKYEMSDEQHSELADVLRSVSGMVVLSGYRCEMYDKLYADWRRVDIRVVGDKSKYGTESLWFSPNCNATQMDLFSNLSDDSQS